MELKIQQQLSLVDWEARPKAEPKQYPAEEMPSYQGGVKVNRRSRWSPPFSKTDLLQRCTLKSETGCWIWQLTKYWKGYGRLTIGRKIMGAHQLAYRLWKGDIPKGLCVLHNCPGGDNAACCNPDHLWLGTLLQNNHDKMAKGRAKSHNRKLTPDEVRQVRVDTRSYTQMAKHFGVSRAAIRWVRMGVSYRDVP